MTQADHQKDPPGKRLFTIRDTVPCNVTFIYQVTAIDEEAARESFKETQSGYVGCEVGEDIGLVTTSLEIEEGDTVKAETRAEKAGPKLLEKVRAVAELRRRWRSQDEAETIDSIEYMDGLDSLDLDAAIAEATSSSSPQPRKPIVIEVRGGVVQDVQNVPPGYEYEIKDYDDLEVEEKTEKTGRPA